MNNNSECTRATQIDTDRRSGQDVSSADLEFFRRHLEQCEDCELEAETLDAIQSDGSSGAAPELEELSGRRLIEAVLTATREAEGQEQFEKADSPSRFRYVPAAAAAAAVVLGLALFWNMKPAPPVNRAADSVEAQTTPKFAATNIVGSRLAVLEGNVRVDAARAVDGQMIPAGREIGTIEGRAAFSLPSEVAVSVAPNTRLAVAGKAKNSHELTLKTGHIFVSVAPIDRQAPFRVITPHGLIVVKGTVFSVDVNDDSSIVRMYLGEVEIVLTTGESLRLAKGNAARFSGTKDSQDRPLSDEETVQLAQRHVELEKVVPFSTALNEKEKDKHSVQSSGSSSVEAIATGVKKAPSILALKRSAQDHRRAGRWREAADVYQRMIREHPDSSESRNALVSLGQLEIEKLARPAKARQHFDRYLRLSGSGPLAQEAMYGKAQALGMLKNVPAEQQALELFIKRYPGALQVPAAKRRLSELSSQTLRE